VHLQRRPRDRALLVRRGNRCGQSDLELNRLAEDAEEPVVRSGRQRAVADVQSARNHASGRAEPIVGVRCSVEHDPRVRNEHVAISDELIGVCCRAVALIDLHDGIVDPEAGPGVSRHWCSGIDLGGVGSSRAIASRGAEQSVTGRRVRERLGDEHPVVGDLDRLNHSGRGRHVEVDGADRHGVGAASGDIEHPAVDAQRGIGGNEPATGAEQERRAGAGDAVGSGRRTRKRCLTVDGAAGIFAFAGDDTRTCGEGEGGGEVIETRGEVVIAGTQRQRRRVLTGEVDVARVGASRRDPRLGDAWSLVRRKWGRSG